MKRQMSLRILMSILAQSDWRRALLQPIAALAFGWCLALIAMVASVSPFWTVSMGALASVALGLFLIFRRRRT